MKLTVIGCSGSFPGPDSPASSYLVEAADGQRVWRILLDAGNGSIGALQRVTGLELIDAVLITHLHPDHFLDLCGLYVARCYHPNAQSLPPLPVYGPPGIAERFAQSYGLRPDEDPGLIYDFRELADQEAFSIGPMEVLPRRVEHPIAAFGLRVEHVGRTLAYTGDTDLCAGLTSLATGVDLLLAEASFQEGREQVRGVHLTGRRAGQAAAAAGAHRLVLTHIPSWTDPQVVLAEATAVFDGPVELARPLASYVLAAAPAAAG